MRHKLFQIRKMLAGVLAAATVVAAIPAAVVSAQEAEERYPYTLFAGAETPGAVTVNAEFFTVNGSIASNGTVIMKGNGNSNGTVLENAKLPMVLLSTALDGKYFPAADTEQYPADYSGQEDNIARNTPLEAAGNLALSGNISLNAGIKAGGDITLSGNSMNADGAVIYSEQGDVTLDFFNVNFTGLIYAPHGEVNITVPYVNLNSAIIIADKITVNAENANINYSDSMAGWIAGNAGQPDKDEKEEDTGKETGFYAYGTYNEETNSIDIEWFPNESTAEYSVLTSPDNATYQSEMAVVGGTGCSYPVTSGFDTKYFKILAVKPDGTSAETIPFLAKRQGTSYVTELLDSDGDGLPDLLEISLGTGVNQADTDADGLTDYEEVSYTGTDPLKYALVTEGLSDAMADSDGDGLSNAEELEIGTNPLLWDTDEDGLSDFEEIRHTGTDPLLPDTDGDGIPDGDEIKIGLDPGNPATFGVPDAEYRVEQRISAESEALEAVNTEENPYRLSLDIAAAGYVEGNLSVRESSYAGIIRNEAVLGIVPELSYPQEDSIERVTLRFEISEEYMENILGLFPEEEEFTGIKRLNVFQYFEELNMLLPIETKFDMEKNTIYTETDGLGTYCIMDMELWLAGLGIMEGEEQSRPVQYAVCPEKMPEADVGFQGDMSLKAARRETEAAVKKAPVLRTAAEEEKMQVSGTRGIVKLETPVDLVFLLQSAGNSWEDFLLQKEMIENVTERIYDEYAEVRVCIIEYGETSASFAGSYSYPVWQPASAYLSSALAKLEYTETDAFCNRGAAFSMMKELEFRENAAKFVFHLANGNSGIQAGFFSELDVCAQQKINYTEILPMGFYYSDENFTEMLRNAIEKTNGLSLTYSWETPEVVYEHITTHIAPPQVRFKAILPTGWQTVVLNGILDPENAVDTDGDGLTDWEEVNTDRLRWGTDGSVILPSIQDCMAYPEKTYAEAGLERFMKNAIEGIPSDPVWQEALKSWLKNTYVLPVHSDPTSADSDWDGYSDYAEVKKYGSNPLKNEVTLFHWNQEYISVEYAGNENWSNYGSPLSYGGSQMWLFNDDEKKWYSKLGRDYILQGNGCGLISASDVLLYLALKDSQYATGETGLVSKNSFGSLKYGSYISYVDFMEESYFPVLRWIGVIGPKVAAGINEYSVRNRLGLKAKWCSSKEKILPRIEKMLQDDIPVTFSIGPMGTDYGVHFYDWKPQENDKYCFEIGYENQLVSGHYVTITGLLVDDVKKQTMLELSSWGKKYYINYDEYIRTVDAYSNYLFSNIVYIERQQ